METTQNTTRMKSSPKDFFLYLGVIVSLYVSVASVLTLLFEIINQLYPNVLGYNDPYSSGVSLAMAMLIVAFPLCIIFIRAISKEEALFPEKRELWVRRALAYCTLFISIFVIAGDLIVLLRAFFAGEEITVAFGLKVLAIILVFAAVAHYYLHDLRASKELNADTEDKVKTYYGYGASIFVALAIIFGFIVMGSPASQREKRFDAMRVEHLNIIQSQVLSYWQTKQKLPATLNDLNDPLFGFVPPIDPKTNLPYEYSPQGKLGFKICASFSRESKDVSQYAMSRYEMAPTPYPYKGGIDGTWQHEIGRTCFDRTIDPERYPPYVTREKTMIGGAITVPVQ